MEQSLIRAWWAHRQGLDGTLLGRSAAQLLERTGWARSIGGAGPYLTLFSRGGIGREAADRAAAAVEIQELTAARGCTYIVPAADYGLALTAAAGHTDGAMKAALKLGVTDREIDTLSNAILGALSDGEPLDPDQIRAATGNASRSLGEAGRKKGVGTTLPLGLSRLQAAGAVRRLPMGGRLDQQRYRYRLWESDPLAGFTLSRDEALTELARRYFEWIGPATIDEFRAFAGLGVKAGENAVAPLRLVPLEAGDARLMLPADRERLREFVPPPEPRYALVSSVDGIVLLRRDPAALLEAADGDHGAIRLGGLADLPSHAILDRGRIIGLWEYDTAVDGIAWHVFGAATPELEAAVARTETFVRDQLGDARSFSLDSAKSRAPRVAALREAAAQR